MSSLPLNIWPTEPIAVCKRPYNLLCEALKSIDALHMRRHIDLYLPALDDDCCSECALMPQPIFGQQAMGAGQPSGQAGDAGA